MAAFVSTETLLSRRLKRVLKGKMGTGICSFSVLGIGIFMSFITGNGIFMYFITGMGFSCLLSLGMGFSCLLSLGMGFLCLLSQGMGFSCLSLVGIGTFMSFIAGNVMILNATGNGKQWENGISIFSFKIGH